MGTFVAVIQKWPHFPTLQAQTGALLQGQGVVLRLKSKTYIEESERWPYGQYPLLLL